MSGQAAANRRRRGRKWGRLCVLASAAALPLSSEAYSSASLASRTTSLGPIHLSQSSFRADAIVVCPSSVGSGSDEHSVSPRNCDANNNNNRNRLRMSATVAREAAACQAPARLRASSSVVPPSSYLSHRGPRRICSLGGSPAERYGGRAWGGGAAGGGDVGAPAENTPSGTLGFVIDDADGIGSATASALSSTRLEMVSRTFDGEPVSPAEDSFPDRKAAKKTHRHAKTADDSARGIRTSWTVSVTMSSPLKKRVAESLLGMPLVDDAADLSEASLKVPAWFPWLPTRDQIGALKGSELKEACAERGLDKNGTKDALRARLQDWTREQHERRVLDRRVGLSSAAKSSVARSPLDDMIDRALSPVGGGTGRPRWGGAKSSSPSIGESDLFSRRKELRQSKYSESSENEAVASSEGERRDGGPREEEEAGKSSLPFTSTDENRAALAKLFKSAPAKYSNIEIKQMYRAAKLADKNGDRRLARTILTQLQEATPKDSRVLRRLARLEMEVGDVARARAILQGGIRRNPKDAHLLQGLAQIELKSGDDDTARALLKEAIRADPKLPNPYHALGTLEHSRGNIRVATTVLRHGLNMCPANHRLHHALGDLYREARMLDMAELAYRRALKHAPEWGKSFVYTAMAFLSYEKGDLTQCRQWLHEAVEVNGGMHSQGWLALAHLEESEGRIEDARDVYREAATHYEWRRIQRSFVAEDDEEESSQANPSKSSSSGRKVVKPSLSGDKWIFVYKSWARMEQQSGTFQSADRVYLRATKVFPGNAALLADWARLHARAGRLARVRALFEAACNRAGSDRAVPYRLYAEFEMSRRNFLGARSILYRGAQALSETRDGGMAQSEDLAHLYHTWAVCEWHLGDLDRTEVLFDRALRLTDAGQGGSEIRSLILYSIARFLYDARCEYVLAQHCVCLSLKENFLPGGNSQIWHLWAEIAGAMDNDDLAEKCVQQADKLSEEEIDSNAADLSRLLGLRDVGAGDEEASSLPMITGPAVQKMLRREPWDHKIKGAWKAKRSWYEGAPFPELSESHRTENVKSSE